MGKQKTEEQKVKVIFKIRGIEELHFLLDLPKDKTIGEANSQFSFNIDIENKADKEQKLLFSTITVQTRPKDREDILSTLKISYIFGIENFEEVVTLKENNTFEAPGLLEIINNVSLSTTRGIMHEKFRGTFLHGAVLPMIDPKKFNFVPNK